MKRLEKLSPNSRVKGLLDAVSKVHGVDRDAVSSNIDKVSAREVQRAKNQFRYLVSEGIGVREAARKLGCSPSTIVYVRRRHREQYGEDYYYTRLLDDTLAKI